MKYVIMNAQKGFPVAVRETVEATSRCIEYLIAMGTQNTWSVCAIEEDEQLPQDAPEAPESELGCR